ncbi:hypothetical protein [Nocardia sp. NPDC023988]|uniref:hypothetical protein n=1 Tax=unclassified Nocardia TaxID=2637762 RepID=UPI0033C9C76E
MPLPELARISRRPGAVGGLLSTFYVEVESFDDVAGFGRRVRQCVKVGVNASLEGDFDVDSMPEADVPLWMRESWESAALRYAAHRGNEKWTVQDVLFSFDPRQREWAWWDVTKVFGNIVCVWVDSHEEAVYKCEELRWMFYLCGARAVVGPLLRDARDWEQSMSLSL